jgi:hypothetical protein
VRSQVISVTALLCASFASSAQISTDEPVNPNAPQAPAAAPRDASRELGTGIGIGIGRLFPSLGITAGYDDNLTLSRRDEVSSSVLRVEPGLRLEGGDARSRVVASYEADFARYAQSSRDNYVDQRLAAAWYYNPVLRHAFALDASFGLDHDQRGTAAREGDLGLLELDPDRFRRTDVGGKYTFGSAGARGRLEVNANVGETNYRNNRELTQFRDRTDDFLAGAFFWRLAPKTSALLRVEYGGFDYDRATLDSDEVHYYAGVEFDATARTTGSLMVGGMRKHFDDPTREDFSGASWRANVEWRPRSYSIFTVTTGRETDETNGYGDFILRRDVTFGWAHNWNARFRTTVDLGMAREEQRPTTREDQFTYFGIGADYVMRRWLRFGASWRGYQRDSDVGEFDYDRNVYLLSAEISL